MNESSKQEGGDNSTNLQAGNDIIYNKSTFVLYSVEEISKQLLTSAFGELPVETKAKIESNQKSYFGELTDSLKNLKKQSDELSEIISSPDFQFISKTAAITASRTSSEEMHQNLASLIVERINNNDDDLKRIVFDEAIATINKLTVNQLKIITLNFILYHTSHSAVVSLEAYDKYLSTHILPFIDFRISDAEFQHIEYAGCGTMQISSRDYVDLTKQQYAFLFRKLIDKERLDKLSIPPALQSNVVVHDPDGDKYLIKFRNVDELEKYLTEKSLEPGLITELKNIYNEHIMNGDDSKKLIEDKTKVGSQLLTQLEKSRLGQLRLTSVGIAIAISYFEKIVGEHIDINIWIN